MTTFNGTFGEVLAYLAEGATLMNDFWGCIPEPVQNLLFAFFVIIFGSAFVSMVIKILS